MHRDEKKNSSKECHELRNVKWVMKEKENLDNNIREKRVYCGNNYVNL